MDWKTFFVELVNAIAWPAVLLFIVYGLKDNVVQLLPRLKKMKLKDAEIELFEEKLIKLEAENTSVEAALADPENESDLDKHYEFLAKLSEVSPRAAVLESYRVLESASVTAIRREYPAFKSRSGLTTYSVLVNSGTLDQQQYGDFKELKTLRNQAANMADFDLKDMPITAYIEKALALATRLESEKP